MGNESQSSLPASVWTAYFSLNGVGIVVGLLSGAGIISGAALAVFIFAALGVFMPWAIWKRDPATLAECDAYRGEGDIPKVEQ